MNNGCLNRVFSARSALMTKSSRRHHGIHHRRHNLYFFFVITACCFSQRTSPAEQLVRRQSMSSRYRTDRVAARYDYRAIRLQGNDFFVAEDEMSTNRLSGRSRRDDLDGFRTAPRSL